MLIVSAGIAAIILCNYGAHILQGFSAIIFFIMNMQYVQFWFFFSVIDFVIMAYSFCFILNVCSCCKFCFAEYELVPATGFDERLLLIQIGRDLFPSSGM
jgi:hypothetical protein